MWGAVHRARSNRLSSAWTKLVSLRKDQEDDMPDSTIKKVEAASSPRGEMGQKYLVAGKRVSMRLWVLEPGSKVEAATSREYERFRVAPSSIWKDKR